MDPRDIDLEVMRLEKDALIAEYEGTLQRWQGVQALAVGAGVTAFFAWRSGSLPFAPLTDLLALSGVVVLVATLQLRRHRGSFDKRIRSLAARMQSLKRMRGS